MRRYHDELAELGVPADRRADAVERVATAVQRTLADERGRWLLDQRHASANSELELTGRVNGELVSVVIDRTFVDGQGTRGSSITRRAVTKARDSRRSSTASSSDTQRNSSAMRRWSGISGRSRCAWDCISRCCRPGGTGPRASRSRRTVDGRSRPADPGIPANEPGPAAHRPGPPPCPRAKNCVRQRVSMQHRPQSDRRVGHARIDVGGPWRRRSRVGEHDFKTADVSAPSWGMTRSERCSVPQLRPASRKPVGAV